MTASAWVRSSEELSEKQGLYSFLVGWSCLGWPDLGASSRIGGILWPDLGLVFCFFFSCRSRIWKGPLEKPRLKELGMAVLTVREVWGSCLAISTSRSLQPLLNCYKLNNTTTPYPSHISLQYLSLL